jgi:uncharacterized protein (DUF2267 family)
MTMTGLEAIDTTVHKTNEWLHGIGRSLGIESPQASYRALRAVLHALRDRLSVEGAAALGAQLPLLVRGVYYEGWHPHGKPLKVRHADEFLAIVRAELTENLHPDAAVTAVFQAMERHLDPGEMDKLIRQLPRELAALRDPEPEPRDD